MAAAEGFDERRDISLSLHRKGGHLQPRNPALRTRFQGGDVLAG